LPFSRRRGMQLAMAKLLIGCVPAVLLASKNSDKSQSSLPPSASLRHEPSSACPARRREEQAASGARAEPQFCGMASRYQPDTLVHNHDEREGKYPDNEQSDNENDEHCAELAEPYD